MAWRDVVARVNVIPSPNKRGELFALDGARSCVDLTARLRFIVELMVRGTWLPIVTPAALADVWGWSDEDSATAEIAARKIITAAGGINHVRRELIFAEAMRGHYDADARGKSRDSLEFLQMALLVTKSSEMPTDTSASVFRVEMVDATPPKRLGE